MAKARVLTRSELAEHLGVDKKMVTKWERSGMPVHTRGRGVASQFRLREVRSKRSCRQGLPNQGDARRRAVQPVPHWPASSSTRPGTG